MHSLLVHFAVHRELGVSNCGEEMEIRGKNLNKNSKRAAGVIVLCASSMQIESVTAGFKFYIERIWFQLIS